MMEELRELYQEVILDHGKNPRNFRHPANANREAHGHNPMCGDTVTVYLALDEKGVIHDCAFDGRGCAISMASASMMTEILKGKSVDEAQRLFENFQAMCTKDGADMASASELDADAVERLQVLSGVREFPVRVKCATLAWHTMNKAVTEGTPSEAVSTE